MLALIAAGCAAKPAAQFQAVPAPSAGTSSLPVVPNSEPAALEGTKPAAARKPKPSGAKNGAESSLIVVPNPVLTGRVTSFNAAGRFVVLNFPVGHLPVLEQRLDVYRQGAKVGEVKVTGPQRDDHIVADVTTGEAQAGDEVRER